MPLLSSTPLRLCPWGVAEGGPADVSDVSAVVSGVAADVVKNRLSEEEVAPFVDVLTSPVLNSACETFLVSITLCCPFLTRASAFSIGTIRSFLSPLLVADRPLEPATVFSARSPDPFSTAILSVSRLGVDKGRNRGGEATALATPLERCFWTCELTPSF